MFSRKRRRDILPPTKLGYQAPPEAGASQWVCDDCETTEGHYLFDAWPKRCPACAGRIGPLPAAFDRPWRGEALLHEADSQLQDATPGSAEEQEARERVMVARQSAALDEGRYLEAAELERSVIAESYAPSPWNYSRLVMWLLRGGSYMDALSEGATALWDFERRGVMTWDTRGLAVRTGEAARLIGDLPTLEWACDIAFQQTDLLDIAGATREDELAEQLREALGRQRRHPKKYTIEQLFALILHDVANHAPPTMLAPTLGVFGPNRKPTPGEEAWPIFKHQPVDTHILGEERPSMRLLVFPDHHWSWEVDGVYNGRLSIDVYQGAWFYFGIGYEDAARADALAAVARSTISSLHTGGADVPPRLRRIEREATQRDNCEKVLATEIDDQSEYFPP